MSEFLLTVQPELSMHDKPDGTGFDIEADYSGNHAHLKIGNVSLAFDDRNCFTGHADKVGLTIQLTEYVDDPVRINGRSVRDFRDVAENLLLALAMDLGYSIKKNK